MRDMMAVTARPEVISLATGLPDTTTFPAEDFARLMARVAVDSSAAALQYGPTDGLEDVRRCIVQVMAAEGTAVETDDLHGHHRRPAGDRPRLPRVPRSRRRRGRRGADLSRARCRASPPTRPTSCRSRWTTTACASTCSRRRSRGCAREGRAAEVHLHDPELPEPGRRDDVAGAPAARSCGSPHEQELVILEDNPYGLLRYEGDPLPTLYSLDGGRYVDLPRHVLEDPLGRPADRLGGRARSRSSSA